MRISIRVESVTSTPRDTRQIDVELEGCEIGEIIGEIGEGELLDAIGRETAIKHYNIEEAA